MKLLFPSSSPCAGKQLQMASSFACLTQGISFLRNRKGNKKEQFLYTSHFPKLIHSQLTHRKEIKPSPLQGSLGSGNYIHIPVCSVSTTRHPSLPRAVSVCSQLSEMYFGYEAPRCDSVGKGTTTKARKKRPEKKRPKGEQ